MSLHPLPSVFRVPNATAKPRLSGVCERAELTVLLPGPVRRAAAAAERPGQFAVPAGARCRSARRPGIGGRMRRVVDDRDPVDALIDRPGLDADDVVDRLAIDCHRLCEVRRRGGRVVRRERAGGRPVEPVVASGRDTRSSSQAAFRARTPPSRRSTAAGAGRRKWGRSWACSAHAHAQRKRATTTSWPLRSPTACYCRRRNPRRARPARARPRPGAVRSSRPCRSTRP